VTPVERRAISRRSMIVFESQRTRRIVGRIERGEPVLDTLGSIARQRDVRAAWITALGAFEWVELAEYDQQRRIYKEPRRFDSPCEILSLNGNVSLKDGAPFLHIHVTVSRETDNGVEVLGGHLVSGNAFSCEFVLECFDDLGLERVHDPVTGLALWRGASAAGAGPHSAPRAAQPPPEAQRRAAQWADAAAASAAQTTPGVPPSAARAPLGAASLGAAPPPAPSPLPERRRSTDDDFMEEPTLERGDWVDHKQFGLCQVDGEDSDGALVIRLPSGVRKAIRLDYLRVLEPREDGGRRIFPLVPRRRT